MKHLLSLILILLFSLNILGQEFDEDILKNSTYIQRMQQFKNDPLNKGQIVFFGNSITQAGKWQEYFPLQSVANRGISGDNTEGMLARIHQVIEAQPSKLFIMAGINDISMERDNDIIIRNMKMLLRQVKAGSPNTEILVQSTLPINNEMLKYARLKGKESIIENYNMLLKELCYKMEISYIDLYPLLLDSPSLLNKQFTSDGLHINNLAYTIWAEHIKYYVEK